jgi:beta-mannanase
MEKKMKKLLDLGFKKVRGTEKGFVMYELTPAKLNSFDENFKAQAASNKPQAASNKQPVTIRKRLDKSR